MTDFMNPAVDERIVRLNVILKTTSAKKEEKENLKAKKAAIHFILNSWDREDLLTNYFEDGEMKETQYEIWCIVKSRIDQLKFRKESNNGQNPNTQERSTPEKKAAASKAGAAQKTGKKTPKHKVGDLHPNGKWIWKEYKPGKFDWRNKPKDPKDEKSEIKKTTKTITKKETEKKEKPVKQPHMTYEEFLTRLKSHGTKNLTDLQSVIRKYLLRGYKVDPKTDGKTYFLKKEGETSKSITTDSLKGLFRKTGVTDGDILRDAFCG